MRLNKGETARKTRKRLLRKPRSHPALNRHKRHTPSASKQNEAFNAGVADARTLRESGMMNEISSSLKEQIHEGWTKRYKQNRMSLRVERIIADSKHYAQGFLSELNIPDQSWVPIPTNKSAAAIVLTGEGLNLLAVKELTRLPLQEIIVILEGTDEQSFAAVRSLPDITIIHMKNALGQDVGRSVGARLTNAENILFTNGASYVAAEHLAPFLIEVDRNADLALTDTSESVGIFREWNDLTRVKAFMNWSLGRADLLANSVGELPHAWSRKGINLIGTASLAVPPVAHQLAIEHKLVITSCLVPSWAHPVRRKKHLTSNHTGAKGLVVGDHIEALKSAMGLHGSRLAHHDRVRNRLQSRGGLK